MAPIRDLDVAVREELDVARSPGTLAGDDLLVAQHPDHGVADVARRERLSVERGTGRLQ
jgi:hypothetical protein